jgi:hypothetical protein
VTVPEKTGTANAPAEGSKPADTSSGTASVLIIRPQQTVSSPISANGSDPFAGFAERVYKAGEPVSYLGLNYVLTDVVKTKSSKPLSADDFTYFDKRFGETTDADGNLTGNCTYVFLKFKIKNESSQPVQINFGGFSISCSGKQEGSDLRYFSKGKNAHTKDYCYYTFAGNEEADITFGYIVKDESLNDSGWLLCLDYTASLQNNSEDKYLAINAK